MSQPHSLFAPIAVASKTLPSRILLAPINTGFARLGVPTTALLRFHAERSGPEIGISMLGNVAINETAITNPGTAVLTEDTDPQPFQALARMASDRGSLAGIQLAYCPPIQPQRRWVSKSVAEEASRLSSLVTRYTDSDLDHILRQFIASSRLATHIGFDVIQIHGAHGYLVSLLLNPLVNSRSGHFSLTGPWLRAFAQALLDATRGALLSVRLSLHSGLTIDSDEELDCTRAATATLAAVGVQMIDYSAGFYTVDRRLIYPGVEKGALPYLESCIRSSQELQCLFCVSGNVQHLRDLPSLPDNFVVSVGRALVADPDLLVKIRSGRHDAIRPCVRTGRCHYFSRGNSHIECGVNSQLKDTHER